MPDVVVTIGDAEHRGELRAWARDGAGEWWAMVQYRTEPGRQMLGWLPACQVRRDAGT